MNDFVNGLESVSDYLNRTTIELPTGVSADLSNGTIITSTTGFNLKEVICSLLAGNGIKLPNLQLCLKINLDRILNIDAITGPLRNALRAAEEALEAFIAHTNIDNVLSRLNSAIAEFAAIANMINFCGTPVTPRAIPNVLRDTMGSFLGKGEELLNRLGTIIPSEIGGCISTQGGFNSDIFTGGILKDLSQWLDDVKSMPKEVMDSFVTELQGFASDIKNLIKFENNFKSVEEKGGSSFTTMTSLHTGVGMAIDPEAMTFAESQRIAGNLKGLYDSLSAYEVDEEGKNIFDYLLEPSLIDKLKNEDTNDVPLEEKEPVYDHCGRVVGYTITNRQPQPEKSQGAPAQPVKQPATSAIDETKTVVTSSPSDTVNLTYPNPVVSANAPATPIGSAGDRKGDIRTDGEWIYIAIEDYDGVTPVWNRAKLSWDTVPESDSPFESGHFGE